MKLKEIDKRVYRQNTNRVIAGFVAGLTLLSLAFGAGLIALFGAPQVQGGESTGNFHLNLLGVILALLLCSCVLYRLKDKAFLEEIYYVWQLKQLHNQIYRRLGKIMAAAESNDVDALIILKFYYVSLKQVYFLDDNTLTLSKVEKDLERLEDRIARLDLSVSTAQFEPELLNRVS